jgi:hypothetical protein
MPGILRYAVYLGNGVGSDRFSVNVMSVGRLMQREGGGREERSLSECCPEVKWPQKMKPGPSAGRGDEGKTCI